MGSKQRKIVVATRRSELALAQCRQFIARLQALHPALEVEELHVVTTGDRITDRPLSEIGGKGLFLKEIEEALVDGRADLAVHSMKDVPPELPPGLRIGCVPAREDPRDVLVSRGGRALAELEPGSTVGTSSLRRQVQVLAARPDLRVAPLRGNVGTRLRKCEEGVVDATLLARAGLNRLGLSPPNARTLSVEESLPAVGQGALALELREGDDELLGWLAPLEDPETRLTVAAERGVMTAVEGDCKTPVAAFAVRDGAELWIRALLAEPDGARLRRRELRCPWPGSDDEARARGLEVGRDLKEG